MMEPAIGHNPCCVFLGMSAGGSGSDPMRRKANQTSSASGIIRYARECYIVREDFFGSLCNDPF